MGVVGSVSRSASVAIPVVVCVACSLCCVTIPVEVGVACGL